MKKSLFLLLFSLLIRPAFAQKIIEKSLPVTSGQLVNLNLKFADSIRVRYWDKPNVSVRISVTINSGKLNDALTVMTGSTDKEVSLKTDFDKELIKQGKDEDCPKQHYSMNVDRDGKGHTICSDINYQVFVPRQAQLKIETISGNIDIQGGTESVFAKTISGYVDMSWPKSKGANLAMKTITGEVYSDLDIAFTSKQQKNPIVGYMLEGTVNGGGPKVRLESISNNVYLRKKD
ncbi:DUF4097 family beta strand repeat-containing protein [Spirosoma validum]|uniref:DUF4097 domain-containing protein n=1 Tax=Spirosoma validum TaxID=2771355 RepID=A0A927GDE2_9BACT|nr:hypothetical protein [Spirosoma validum]MBD2753624.1 hypothetical protein [Spirosoma validum]